MSELYWIVGIGVVLAVAASLFKDKLSKKAKVEPSLQYEDLSILPYVAKTHIMTEAELNFYRVLQQLFGDKVHICPQFPLSGLFYPKSGDRKTNTTYRNKIDRKTIDFLLCDSKTMKPLAGVELDDSSHQRQDRQRRDNFVNEVFAQAKVPLMRVKAGCAYSLDELRAELKSAIAKTRG